MQQGVHTDTTCNIQQCWKLLVNYVASVYTALEVRTILLFHFCTYGFIVDASQ